MDKANFPGGWFRDDREPDPMHAAQKGLKAALPLRFYKEAGVIEQDGQFAVALDGRTARTPARHRLAVGSRALAEAMAAEWAAQGERIDPASMPVTRLVNSAVDGVERNRDAVAAEIVNYAGSDLLCYRAEGPDGLVRRQHEAWDPVLAWAAEDLGAPLRSGEGIIHVAQSPGVGEAIGRAVARYDAIGVAALNIMTTLTGSAVLALAVARGRLEPEAAWAAAHVDEDFQAGIWGADAEAEARRATRWRDMEAAARVLGLL